jgi:molybdopterin synthase sulfur carrier subunit
MIIVQKNCVDKLPLQSITMGANQSSDSITVLCFGPLAEILGRTSQISITSASTCKQVIVDLGIEEWLNNGLKIAINGEMCDLDSQLSAGDELALLPPVSGG